VRAILITAASSYTRAELEGWASSFTPDALLVAIESTTVFVATQGAAVAGFANLIDRADGRAELDLLYIDPDFVGRRVSSSLIAAVEDEARRRECSALTVDASLLADPVLQHLGYRVVERYAKSRHGETYLNTLLIKNLD